MLLPAYLTWLVAFVLAAFSLVSTAGAEEPSELRRSFLSGTPYEVSIEPPPRPEPEVPETAEPAVEAEPARDNGPLYTLQVGAFRQYGKATELRTALMKDFSDIEVLETQSGGESLFRVRVGHAPSKTGLAELRKQLTAAGYASFPVDAR
jgi:cell division protein FtsN